MLLIFFFRHFESFVLVGEKPQLTFVLLKQLSQPFSKLDWILECVRRYKIALNLGAGHAQLLMTSLSKEINSYV